MQIEFILLMSLWAGYFGDPQLTLQLHSMLKYNKNLQFGETGQNVSIVKEARSS